MRIDWKTAQLNIRIWYICAVCVCVMLLSYGPPSIHYCACAVIKIGCIFISQYMYGKEDRCAEVVLILSVYIHINEAKNEMNALHTHQTTEHSTKSFSIILTTKCIQSFFLLKNVFIVAFYCYVCLFVKLQLRSILYMSAQTILNTN